MFREGEASPAGRGQCSLPPSPSARARCAPGGSGGRAAGAGQRFKFSQAQNLLRQRRRIRPGDAWHRLGRLVHDHFDRIYMLIAAGAPSVAVPAKPAAQSLRIAEIRFVPQRKKVRELFSSAHGIAFVFGIIGCKRLVNAAVEIGFARGAMCGYTHKIDTFCCET